MIKNNHKGNCVVMMRFVLSFVFFILVGEAFAQMPTVDSACASTANAGSYAIGDIGGGEVALLVCDSGGNYRKWMSKNGTSPIEIEISESEWLDVTTLYDTVNWQCRTVGDQVFFKGKLLILAALPIATAIGTLPTECRPTSTVDEQIWHFFDNSAGQFKFLEVNITSAGLVTIQGSLGLLDKIALNQYSFSKP